MVKMLQDYEILAVRNFQKRHNFEIKIFGSKLDGWLSIAGGFEIPTALIPRETRIHLPSNSALMREPRGNQVSLTAGRILHIKSNLNESVMSS